jgi:hypothetical protein
MAKSDVADRLQLRCPEASTDTHDLYDLTAKCFSGAHNYYQWYRGADGYFQKDFYDWQNSTVGVLEGRMVTHWGIWDYLMRVGNAKLRTAGIGAVATCGFHRKLGLMDITARAGIERAARAGYDLSVLFGIGDFYHKFGYVRAWTPTVYRTGVDNLPLDADAPEPQRGPYDPADKAIQRIYNREHKGLTGSAVRPTYRSCIEWKQCERWSWKDKAGRLTGYVITAERGKDLHCLETGGKVQRALAVLGKIARTLGHREVCFPSLHEDHPTAHWLRAGNSHLQRQFIRSGGPMIRILNLRSVLGKLAPVLSARLGSSALAGWKGRLLISEGREKVVLDFHSSGAEVCDAGKADHAIRGDDHIAQLLIGTGSARETLDAAGIRLSGDADMLLPVLFPAQRPMLRELDHF